MRNSAVKMQIIKETVVEVIRFVFAWFASSISKKIVFAGTKHVKSAWSANKDIPESRIGIISNRGISKRICVYFENIFAAGSIFAASFSNRNRNELPVIWKFTGLNLQIWRIAGQPNKWELLRVVSVKKLPTIGADNPDRFICAVYGAINNKELGLW